MILKSIILKNFRNYNDFITNFENTKNIIYGKNGSGKTSLIEAIYLLSYFKSFRASDIYLTNYNSDTFYIKGEILKNNENIAIEISYSVSKKTKKIKKNSKEVKQFFKEHGNLNLILFQPQDLNLIDGSPEFKREFLDDLFSQIDISYAENLYKYNKILESRNFILREDLPDKIKNIETLNEPLIKYGTEIIYKRIKYISELKNFFNDELEKIELKKLSPVKIEYITNLMEPVPEDLSVEEISKKYKEKLTNNLDKEMELKFTIFGPHRDSFLFKNKLGYDLKSVFSTGEKRIVTTLFKFAEFFFVKNKISDTPVILMDDIFLEIDTINSKILIDFINKINAQFFITTTDINQYSQINNKKVIELNGEN